MKKYILSIFVAALVLVYIIFGKKQAAVSVAPQTVTAGQDSLGSSTAQNFPVAPSSTTATSAITQQTISAAPRKTIQSGQYKNGTFIGSVADAFYGNVQVQTSINSGKITDVKFLQYPTDRHESQQISSFAIPRLIAEAIQAQSANVDIVSGATQTSEAFKLSLASAIRQAKN